jgi:SAM-dependent methyltransferase
MMNCRACRGRRLTVLIDHAPPGLTSLAMPWPHRTCVRHCADCGHLGTESFDGIQTYYEENYDTVGEGQDDLLGFDSEGRPLYRVQQQCKNMLGMIDAGVHGRMLDFGCGHGVFMRRFLECRPEWQAFGYEISDRYAHRNVFIGELPDDQFDLITSFYVLEHVEDPICVLRQLRERLKENGTLFFAVPDTIANPIDVLAADHLSHFGLRSLRAALANADLTMIGATATLMPGTWLVAAKPIGSIHAPDAIECDDHADLLGSYWADADQTLREATARINPPPQSVAIYGAGVYGAYLKSRAALPTGALSCFIDQNPRKHGTMFHDLPVRSLDGLEATIETVLIGLRPDQAEKLAATAEFKKRHCIHLPPWSVPCTA